MNAPLKHIAEPATTFVRRHIGPSPRDVSAMLETVGAKNLGALMAETLPSSIRQQAPLDLGTALSETEALAHMRELASQNEVFASLIKDRDNQYLMLDSTLVRAHQQAATGKGGTKIRLWGAPEVD